MNLARIEALEANLAATRAGVQATQGAMLNRVYAPHIVDATPVTAGMSLISVACLIQARVSGIFSVSFNTDYSGATAAAAVLFSINSQNSVGAITLASVNAAEGSTSATATNPMTNGSAPGIFSASAAGGITVSAGGGSTHAYASETTTMATGQTTGTFAWGGIVDNSAAGGTPFTIGNFIAFYVLVNSGTSAVTLGHASLSVCELPG